MINNYKTKSIIYKNNKEKMKNDLENEYGYNFDSKKRNGIDEDYSRVYVFKNKEYYSGVNRKM